MSTSKNPKHISSAVKGTLERALQLDSTSIGTQPNQPCLFHRKVIDRLITKCRESGVCFSKCEWDSSQVHLRPPSTCSRVLWKTETFFSEYGYRLHVTGVFGHRKRRFSNTLSRVESFENGDSSYSCGRVKTEVFKYDDVMSRIKARCSLFRKYDLKTLGVETDFFQCGGKKTSVFENTRLRVGCQIQFKNPKCGRRFFF